MHLTYFKHGNWTEREWKFHCSWNNQPLNFFSFTFSIRIAQQKNQKHRQIPCINYNFLARKKNVAFINLSYTMSGSCWKKHKICMNRMEHGQTAISLPNCLKCVNLVQWPKRLRPASQHKMWRKRIKKIQLSVFLFSLHRFSIVLASFCHKSNSNYDHSTKEQNECSPISILLSSWAASFFRFN